MAVSENDQFIEGQFIEDQQGQVYPVYFVMCGACKYEMPIVGTVSSRTYALSKLKEWGWKRTRKHGYVCKDCAAK